MNSRIKHILERAGVTQFKEHELLANYTTYKIGGPADIIAFPAAVQQLQSLIKGCRDENISYFIMGKGSNVLVSDEGLRGITISLEKCASHIRKISDSILEAGAGLTLREVVEFAEKNEVEGFEYLSGIPGTVGGALIMNAGAFVGEIGERVIEIETINQDGFIEKMSAEEAGFGYRRANGLQGKIIFSVTLKGNYQPGIRKTLAEKRKDYIARREQKQPLQYGSCGSVFKRPQGTYAGKLIEESGCKGLTVGRAQVSEKHANFIVNLGGATASDVYQLINKIRETVYKKFKIVLEPEVKFIGEFPPLWTPQSGKGINR